MALFLVFFFLFSLETLEENDNFYVVFESAEENPTFSSYRLSNPERIVFEANGSFEDSDFSNLPPIVKSVEKNFSGGMTRFVFFVESGAQYTFFNRKGTIIIAFSRSVFLDDDNFDTIIAKFTARREAERIAQSEKARKIEEERLIEEERRKTEEKLIAELQKAEEERRIAEEKRIA
ncbi:AMIN domain-containing protein, partial [bacterium]|nr:AMIN domain-containing protein [bacterium]